MATGNRRTVLVLVLIGFLCVVLYLGGLLGGARRASWTPSSDGQGIPGAAVLTGDDLRPLQGEACRLGSAPMTFTGTCSYAVDRTGGRFALTGVVRRAKLVVTTGPVAVTATVEGREITTTVKSGRSTTLTIGKAGGRLALTCGTALPPGCAAALTEDGS